MDLFEIIKTRRSIRKFKEKKVPKEIIKKIIDAGRYAPTACNIQGARFIIIDDKRIIKHLVRLGAATFIKDSQQGILVVYDNRTDNIEYEDHIQSASAIIQNMLLAAHNLNIGTCWVCHLPQKKRLRNFFRIPSYYDPIAYITLGYPNEKPIRKRKHHLNEIIFHNKFNLEEKEEQNTLKLYSKRILRKIYFHLPLFIKDRIRKQVTDKFEKKFE